MGYQQIADKLCRLHGVVSTQMIVDMLRSFGYRIVHEAPINSYAIASTNTLISVSSTTASSSGPLADSSAAASILLFDSSVLADGLDIPSVPAITLGPPEKLAHLIEDAPVDALKHLTIVESPLPESHTENLSVLQDRVSNFILTVKEFVNACDQVTRNSNSFQKLTDIASEYFGYFLNITDAHGVLLAFTKSVEPLSKINRDLVKDGYLKDDESITDASNGYLPGHIQSKPGVQAHTAFDNSGQALLTYVMYVQGQYFGHIAMELPERDLTQGLIDAFALFVPYCEYAATTINRLAFTNDFGTHNLMRTLITERHLDSSLLYDQANKIPIPTTAYFLLISFSIDFEFRDQLEMFAQEVDGYIAIGHQTFVHDTSLYTLLYADEYQTIAEEFNRFFDFSFKYASHTMYASDFFLDLADAYLAAREIEAIHKYSAFITHVRKHTNSKKPAHVFVFLDAFCFYWSDPLADNEIRGFSIERTLINTIARDDRLNGTDHLALLNAYLLNGCKAAAIASEFHMHRNGIQYRIDKIAKTYDIDLDDFITRQYLQTSLRVQLVASGKFVLDD